MYLSKNVSIVLSLEPRNSVLLRTFVRNTNSTPSSLSSCNSETGSTHHNVEVHTVDTDTWVVLDTKVDVFLDTETKVSGLGEVSVLELVFFHLQSSLQDLVSLWSSDSNVNGDLLISSDTKSSNSVSGFALHWSLTRQLFQHLGCSGQSVTRLTNTDVENQLLNLEFFHRVLARHVDNTR
ncbi:hypothetical protein OGAPHI_001655 [Ogataea philodendri]|uniref:Uncharacterized protein n=1 Tax=Ogataea philodendri TaxID=1378263 RepID=A0A9P8PD35_9ASCO|nr:uncharacterized protein OGAPHI_001655 [Ogataea philodendri]KAH3669059.1 hypothetical protein OGAPHI_001655 [Ogataea philodendri]